MLGYAATLVMHMITAVHITTTFTREAVNDAAVKEFHDNQHKFMTVWNVYMQMLYAALGLSCDVLALSNEGKISSLQQTLQKIRDPMFSSVVWPYAFTTSFVFWSAYSYDRSLILPPSVDQTLTWGANHVIHTAIMPVVLWELVFRPQKTPETHVANLMMMNGYAAGYLVVIVSSYMNTGTWVYPILNILYGTIYFYIFLVVSVLLTQIFYSLQWYITSIVWKNFEEIKKVN
ncbi:androgen-dependent TFPI-regulating protein-like [Helicoverpa armigera]|uniref:androgen-dependent TFPI-regulating protein-like n=1 Tax=Helicoverpa armigera TaxID=29058 RepID=UPI0030831DFA